MPFGGRLLQRLPLSHSVKLVFFFNWNHKEIQILPFHLSQFPPMGCNLWNIQQPQIPSTIPQSHARGSAFISNSGEPATHVSEATDAFQPPEKEIKIPKAYYAFNWLVLPNLWHSLYFYLIPEGHYENKQCFWSPAILVTSPKWLTNQPPASTAPPDPPIDYLQKSRESFWWVCKWLGLTEEEEDIIYNCL